MEDYLKVLLEQIRCKKACPRIEQEMRSHIEDQAEANRTEWMMEEEEAIKCALRDMGDPIEAGVKLDQIHRPQIAWDLVVLMAVVSIINLIIHSIIGIDMEGYIFYTALHILIGFLAMLFVYRMDYSILADWGKISAVVFLIFMTAEIFFLGEKVNGSLRYVSGSHISIGYLMFLYIPLYAAVLYQYRTGGWKSLGKILFFTIYPVWLVFRMPNLSLAVLLLLILSVMLTVAVMKNWFQISGKIFISCYWGLLFFLPAGFVFTALRFSVLPEYQMARFRSILEGRYKEYDYVTGMLIQSLKSSRMFGRGCRGHHGHH